MPPKSSSKTSKMLKPSPVPKLERPPKGKVELEKPGVKYVYRKDAFRKVKIA